MRYVICLGLFATMGCTAGPAPVEPVKVEFKDVVGEWVLAPGAEATTDVSMRFAEHTLAFGAVPGACAPVAKLPFTEVQEQKSLAALECTSPDGGTHNIVIVEVQGGDPSWPAPVALGMVMSRVTADNQVSLVTMGGTEVPLGIVPKAPVVAAKPTPAESEPTRADTD